MIVPHDGVATANLQARVAVERTPRNGSAKVTSRGVILPQNGPAK